MPEQEVLKEKQTQNGNLTSGQLPTAKDTDRDSVLRANGSLSTSVDVAQAKLEKSIVQANNYFSGTAKQLQTLREQDSWFRLDRSYIREQIRNLEIELEAQERRIQELKKQLEESRKREEESSRFASEAHELSKQGRLQDAKEKSDKAAASLSLAGSSITNTASIDIDATRASIKASQEISERHLQFEAELAKGERNFSKLGAVENATRLYNYVSSDKGQQEIEGFFSRAYDLITSEETWTKIGDGIVTAATFAKKATVFGAEQLANFAAEVWRDPSKIWTAAATALSVGWQGIKFIAEETGLANLGRGLLAL
ncbi:MAG: hypothetical protein DCC75_11465, partial [Proteobacteria bacterium]